MTPLKDRPGRREDRAVLVETLNVRGMARGPPAKSMHDAGCARFLSFCEYKAAPRRRQLA
ncbi:hypothetical protein ABT173_21405 [Streptomyces sp. NPDC001795]|uniref:hypothetical protein n=1 Tax=unclassified Streptomyces TaxID=2593676 RepID=UPI00331B7EF8